MSKDENKQPKPEERERDRETDRPRREYVKEDVNKPTRKGGQ